MGKLDAKEIIAGIAFCRNRLETVSDVECEYCYRHLQAGLPDRQFCATMNISIDPAVPGSSAAEGVLEGL